MIHFLTAMFKYLESNLKKEFSLAHGFGGYRAWALSPMHSGRIPWQQERAAGTVLHCLVDKKQRENKARSACRLLFTQPRVPCPGNGSTRS